MNMTRRSAAIISVLAFSLLVSCGGGDGGGSGGTQPVTALMTLSTSGTLPAGAQISGIDVTITLPAGVTLKSTVNPPEVDSGVITWYGVSASSNTVALATYTAATNNAAGRVRIVIVTANGFSVGELCDVSSDIAKGSSPQAADFGIASFAVSDQNGNVITGLTPSIAVELR